LDKIAVIPKHFRNLRNQKLSNVKYFAPRFIKLRTGQTNTWVNRDTEPHELVSGNAEYGRPDGILNTGIIEPGKSFSKRFDNAIQSIPYFCIRHPEERGTVIIYDKFEDEMTMKERIEHLKQVFALDNVKQQQQQQQQQEDIVSTLSRYEDPVVREGYYHHELETIHNRILTIVFWDISSFSKLCNVLKNEPHLIVEFLQEYFTKANKIIHNHNGILDKFLGDGIMAYFGYKASDDGEIGGAVNSIKAAFELKKSFEEMKSEWMDIWKKQFHHRVKMIDLKCGINTGETLVGKLSTIERDQFTAFGPTVNLASRLEEKAKGNQIIISENTKNNLSENRFKLKTIMVDPDDKIKAFEFIDRYYEVLD
jgi:class 3 adenylate cyclase/plastocyanin